MIDLELPAGRKLDAIIAEKVMGWTREEWPDFGNEGKGCAMGPWEATGMEMRYRFNPSENIAHAWEVVEKLAQLGRNLVLNHTGSQYRCRFLALDGPRIWDWAQDPNDGFTVWNESAPLAICRAAIMATR